MAEDILNSLDQFNDVEEIDPNAMATDARPLPPAGRYQIRLKIAQDAAKNNAKRIESPDFPGNNIIYFQMKDGSKHLMIVVTHEIISENPKFNGQRWDEWMSSKADKFTQTSQVDTLLRAITGRAGVGMRTNQKVKHLYDILVTEPIILAEIEWKGQVPKLDPATGQPVLNDKGKKEYVTATIGGKKAVRMANFPKISDNPEVFQSADVTDDNGESVFVGVEVAKYLPAMGGQTAA